MLTIVPKKGEEKKKKRKKNIFLQNLRRVMDFGNTLCYCSTAFTVCQLMLKNA